MSMINISSIENLLNGKNFDEICKIMESRNISVRFGNNDEHSDLYLLYSNDTKIQKNETQNENQKNDTDNKIQKNCIDIELPNIEESDDIVKDDLYYQCNGLILDKNTNKIVGMCQNKMINIDNKEELKSIVSMNNDSDNKKIRIEYCEDGTSIRLYNWNGVWYTATTKCIDARSSYWSCEKSFDKMFWDIFDKGLLNQLDTKYTYLFILLHVDNRIVVKHKKNSLVYVSRINNQTYQEDFTNYFYWNKFNLDAFNIESAERKRKIYENQSFDEEMCEQLINEQYIYDKHEYDRQMYSIRQIKRQIVIKDFQLNKLDEIVSNNKRGILIKIYDEQLRSWKLYKYDFENYKLIKEARGNIPNIKLRYLELMREPELLDILEKNYTEYGFMFSVIKNCVNKLVKKIYLLYVNSHIKHNIQVEADNLYYQTLRQLHGQYKVQNKPITYDAVKTKLINLDKNVIYKLLEWKNEKRGLIASDVYSINQ